MFDKKRGISLLLSLLITIVLAFFTNIFVINMNSLFYCIPYISAIMSMAAVFSIIIRRTYKKSKKGKMLLIIFSSITLFSIVIPISISTNLKLHFIKDIFSIITVVISIMTFIAIGVYSILPKEKGEDNII